MALAYVRKPPYRICRHNPDVMDLYGDPYYVQVDEEDVEAVLERHMRGVAREEPSEQGKTLGRMRIRRLCRDRRCVVCNALQ